jgi:hypothetical protein
MIALKPGVMLCGLKAEMAIGLSVVASCYEEFNRKCIVTSGTEGVHSSGSHHYMGLALDFRTRHLSLTETSLIANLCKECLTDQFDVITESTHLHVEYNPEWGYNKS